MTSPFSSRVRRPILPPIGLQSVFREVRTEDELRQALTPTSTTTVAALANSGRRIVIAGPITLKSPIVIPPELIGVTIEGHGSMPLHCGVNGIDAFDIRASLVTIRGLVLYGTPTKRWARAFVLDSESDLCRIFDNHVTQAIQLVVDEGVGLADYVWIGNNSVVSPGSGGDIISVDSFGWRVTGNILILGGTPVAVGVGANGGRCAITGNDCGAGDITTSASTGSNTISANTNVGAVTAHATDDALGGNT